VNVCEVVESEIEKNLWNVNCKKDDHVVVVVIVKTCMICVSMNEVAHHAAF